MTRAAVILRVVAEHYGCDADELLGPRRHRQLVVPRHTAITCVAVLCPDLSLPAIGAAVRRDHTTVMYALGRVASHGKTSSRVDRRALPALLERCRAALAGFEEPRADEGLGMVDFDTLGPAA